jgi:hypothetical protein
LSGISNKQINWPEYLRFKTVYSGNRRQPWNG